MKDRARLGASGRVKTVGLGDGQTTAPQRLPEVALETATPQKSYFCDSYRQFFDHTLPRFMQIAAAVEKGTLARRTRPAKTVRVQIE